MLRSIRRHVESCRIEWQSIRIEVKFDVVRNARRVHGATSSIESRSVSLSGWFSVSRRLVEWKSWLEECRHVPGNLCRLMTIDYAAICVQTRCIRSPIETARRVNPNVNCIRCLSCSTHINLRPYYWFVNRAALFALPSRCYQCASNWKRITRWWSTLEFFRCSEFPKFVKALRIYFSIEYLWFIIFERLQIWSFFFLLLRWIIILPLVHRNLIKID